MGVRHTPTHSALPNWREPVAHPLTTRMSSNLGFRVINPLASPNLGGTSCASDRVGWPNLSFPRTRQQAGSGWLRAKPPGSPRPRSGASGHLFFSCPKIDRTAPARAAARLKGRPRQAAQPLAHPRGDPAARTPRRGSCGERPGKILCSAERASFTRIDTL